MYISKVVTNPHPVSRHYHVTVLFFVILMLMLLVGIESGTHEYCVGTLPTVLA
jgi:hypothetical protein